MRVYIFLAAEKYRYVRLRTRFEMAASNILRWTVRASGTCVFLQNLVLAVGSPAECDFLDVP